MTKSYMEAEMTASRARDQEYAQFVTQKVGTKPWPDRILEAKASGSFTYEDRGAAESWVTCACGQQDARIARDAYGTPKDPCLHRFGLAFMDYVRFNDFDAAEYALMQIEKRAVEIIEAEQSKS